MGLWVLCAGVLVAAPGAAQTGQGASPEKSAAPEKGASPEKGAAVLAGDSHVDDAPIQAKDDSSAPGEGPVPGGAEGCIAAHEQAQIDRLEGRLLAANAGLAECAQSSCPRAVRLDCVSWQSEIRREIPSIVVDVRADEGDVEQAQIYIDGVLVSERLDGRPLSVDPGAREVRVVRHDGSEKSARVVLRQGEKDRGVVIDFRKPRAAEQPQPVSRPVTRLTWILAGTAVVASGVGIGFGADALSKRNAASDECAPLCSSEITDSVDSSALAADISFAVAGVAAVGAIVTYVLRPTRVEAAHAPSGGRRLKESEAASTGRDGGVRVVGVTPLFGPTGALVMMQGSF